MTPIEEYVKIEQQIAELEVRKDELKEALMDSIDENGGEALVTEFGSFRLGQRKTYTYSPAVNELEANLKQVKKDEEASGLAEVKSWSRYLRFDKAKAE